MDQCIDLNILEAESAADYHAKTGQFLSSHQLLDFMRWPTGYEEVRMLDVA